MSYILQIMHIQCFKRMEPAWFVHVFLCYTVTWGFIKTPQKLKLILKTRVLAR